MARTRAIDEPQVEELNMTPMIDVIFQLLIFFMCAGQLKALEGKLQTFLPDRGVHGSGTPVPEVRLFLRTEGATVAARLEQRPLGAFPADRERLTAVSGAWDRVGRETEAVWRGLLAQDPRAAVKLDAGDDVPFQYVVSALDACRRAGVKNIDFAASGRVHAALNRER